MAALLLTCMFSLACAGYLLAQAAGLHRKSQSPALVQYFLYLLCWYLLVLYMAVYLCAPGFLPKESHYGYLLFNSIFVIPLHGGVAYFFTAMVFNITGGRIPNWLKACLILAFMAILVTYSVDIAVRLSVDPTPASFNFSAPLSLVLMFIVLLSALIDASFIRRSLSPGLTRDIRLFAAWLVGGLVVGLAFVFGLTPFVTSEWQIILSTMVMALVNIPAWFPLKRILAACTPRFPQTIASADLSGLQERFGISPREQEVIALVIQGKTNRQIEAELFITTETVKKHIYNIYRKTGVKNRVQLVNAVLGTAMMDNPAE